MRFSQIQEFFTEDTKQCSLSDGYYDSIPIRVGEFVCKTNDENQIIFETTSTRFCSGEEPLSVVISRSDGWSVELHEDSRELFVPSVNSLSELTARNRVLWHAVQYMAGRNLSQKQRFAVPYQVHAETTPSLRDDDAFFANTVPVTQTPFEEFLE